MRILGLLIVALLAVGCGPSAGIPAAAAQGVEYVPVAYPAVVEGAADGHVFEYH